MTRTLWVGVGGALGAMARYQLGSWIQRLSGGQFPAGTLAVNVVGSFLISVFIFLALHEKVLPTAGWTVLTAGVLGGFTTYSAFNHETLALLRAGDATTAIANVAATLFGCAIAGALGWAACDLALAR